MRGLPKTDQKVLKRLWKKKDISIKDIKEFRSGYKIAKKQMQRLPKDDQWIAKVTPPSRQHCGSESLLKVWSQWWKQKHDHRRNPTPKAVSKTVYDPKPFRSFDKFSADGNTEGFSVLPTSGTRKAEYYARPGIQTLRKTAVPTREQQSQRNQAEPRDIDRLSQTEPGDIDRLKRREFLRNPGANIN